MPGIVQMSKPSRKPPVCIVIAGPNGAGKTTFAREFLPKDAGIVHFVNADLIASGLSPLRPELAALAAGRLFLRELDRLVNQVGVHEMDYPGIIPPGLGSGELKRI